ncbi:putative vacuolar ATP synthase subunit E [Microstroma glucosiphilum]|uniref:Putative vacuolar ATP synthase subunit E n=1 Tax=Pseudomicrostroma glucosiphilum TaxID=1684307 RepID=A0A316UAC1_9BASI|nr:putative vacuolar ATP synthase subunit E [Pseudomicrostroma glucosiphilum]PWN22112.1 putative vacuolar ATP synthase subunit E [Pseudomicrostroma glucosiphilum]
MSRPMNDDEVLNEMKKMVAFIKQEAMEKAREIQVKADEEFAIEKSKIVRQEAVSIDSAHEKKIKQAQVANKISESNATNKARLSVLQARDSHLEDLFEGAREKLVGLSKDEKKYSTLLKDLITQGLLRLMEKKVTVTCRDKDEKLVKKAADEAKKQYKEKSGRDVEIEVVKGLNKDSNGGVLLAGHGGRIKVDNTLDERMKLLEELMLPEIRLDLFGANPNRKFSS